MFLFLLFLLKIFRFSIRCVPDFSCAFPQAHSNPSLCQYFLMRSKTSKQAARLILPAFTKYPPQWGRLAHCLKEYTLFYRDDCLKANQKSSHPYSFYKDESHRSRVTTLLHRKLTLSASLSTGILWHHNGCLPPQPTGLSVALPSSLSPELYSIKFPYWKRSLRDSSSETSILTAFGAKLLDVFKTNFLCASHQPAAFCSFHWLLLVPITALPFSIEASWQIVKVEFCHVFFSNQRAS